MVRLLKKEDLLQLRKKLNVSENSFIVSKDTYNDFKENIIKRVNVKYSNWEKNN